MHGLHLHAVVRSHLGRVGRFGSPGGTLGAALGSSPSASSRAATTERWIAAFPAVRVIALASASAWRDWLSGAGEAPPARNDITALMRPAARSVSPGSGDA